MADARTKTAVPVATCAEEAKAAARAAAFARRDALSPEVRAEKSAAICAGALQEIAQHCAFSKRVQDKPLIAAYYEIRTEVNVSALRSAAWDQGWRVALPCVITPGHIEFFEVARNVVEAAQVPFIAHPARACSLAELQDFLRERGIDETACCQVAPKDIDAIIVPLVAFNPEGGRLGYGGGNYDRYLPRMAEGSLQLGVAFCEQRDDALRLEPHDCCLAKVITA